MKAEHRIKSSELHSVAAEHRKELRTNALADRMGRFMQTVRHRPRGRTLLISAAVILLIVGLLIYWAVRNTRANENSLLWMRLYDGMVSPGAIISEYPNSKPAEIAQIQKDWYFLWDTGRDKYQIPIDRTGKEGGKKASIFGGILNLKYDGGNTQDAAENWQAMKVYLGIVSQKYEEMFDKTKGDPNLGSEALYDLAVIQETMAAFELKSLETAKATFKKVADDYKETARGYLALQRLRQYYDDAEAYRQMREFYGKLAKGGEAE